MKHLVLVGDGMADFPLPELDGRTPLQAANTPAMDALAREGLCALFRPIPEGFPPGSDIGNLSLFGYDPAAAFTGRAPLEAANQGIALGPDQVVFRCNLVTLADGQMRNFTAGHIGSEEGAELISALNGACDDLPVRFYPGVGYRHLAVLDAPDGRKADFAKAACTPPHDIQDMAYASFLPDGAAGEFIQEIMDKAAGVFAEHPVNARRAAAGKPSATSVWLWGQGFAPRLESYEQRFGLKGAVISAVDLVKGIGVCAGLRICDVPGATGYIDTDYAGKVQAARDALDAVDFVYLHVEAPDETAHEGRTDLKIQAIEDFDSQVVAPCRELGLDRGDCRILVAPDHVTALSTRTHAAGPVPFALWGPGIASNGAAAYSEAEGAKAGILFSDGFRLVPTMLTEETVSVSALAAGGAASQPAR